MQFIRITKAAAFPSLAGILLPPLAFGFFHFRGHQPPKMIQDMANAEGVSPVTLEKIYSAMDDLSSNKNLKSGQWEDLIVASHDSNPQTRKEAFSAIGLARHSRFEHQALSEVRRMATDADAKVRDAYCWELYMLRAPDWQTVAEKAVSSADPGAQGSGKMALQSGEADRLSTGSTL